MKEPLKIGILGAANIAQRSLIPAILALPSHYMWAGIASRDAVKAKVLAEASKVQVFEDYSALLEQADLNAVYIPLPNALHAKWVRAALEKGLHVLVEKSLACSWEEARALTDLARKQACVLVENFQFRFHPQLQHIRDLLSEGAIGEIRCLRASFGFPPFPDADNIRYQPVLGGGALLDAGAYTTKISQLLLGEGLEVKAATLNRTPGQTVDIWGGAYLQHPDTRVFAELAFGFDHHYQCGIEVWGSLGKLSTNRLFTAPPGFEPEILVEKGRDVQIHKAPAANHFQHMLLHFHHLLTSGEGVEAEHAQNIDQARLLTQIREIAHAR